MPSRLRLAEIEGHPESFDLSNPEGERIDGHLPRALLESSLRDARSRLQRAMIAEDELAWMREDRAWILGRRLYERPWIGKVLTRLLGLHRKHRRA